VNVDETYELRLAPYRLLSDADLRRTLNGPSLFVIDRACALREIERRAAIRAAGPMWQSRN
jgi:hypothetical protein